MLKVVLPIALQRNLQGIMPASRILEGESALPLFTEVRGRGFSEVRQEEFIGNSSEFARVLVGWVSTFSEQLLLLPSRVARSFPGAHPLLSPLLTLVPSS
jgi:hypothetical protein